MTHSGHNATSPVAGRASSRAGGGVLAPSKGASGAPGFASVFGGPTTEWLPRVPSMRPATDSSADSGHDPTGSPARTSPDSGSRIPPRNLQLTAGTPMSRPVPPTRTEPGLPVPMRPTAASPRSSPRTREDGVEQATLTRRGFDEPRLNDDEIRLLAQIASGVTADVAARKLELSARTLRRRLRAICDQLDVNTPIEAVVWAARRQLI